MIPLRFSLVTDKQNKMYIHNSYIHEELVTDFQAFVAPETFTKPTQYSDFGLSLNIYQIYKDYSNANKKLIYEFTSAIATLTLPVVSNVTYRWGETIAGVDYVYDVASGTAFTEGSTNRYVIVNNTSTAQLTIILPLGSIWSYLSSYINNVSTRNNTYIKYVFCEELLSITNLSKYGAFNSTSLIGTATITEAVSSIGTGIFGGSAIDKMVVKTNLSNIVSLLYDAPFLKNVYMYPLVAPLSNTNLSRTTKCTLHIKSGATGYDVVPWNNTAIFSQIIQDL